MVARGDLGVEVRMERLPILQKQIIDAACKKGKIAITATQMLDSMERNPSPTRAETTDVANAILDGTDAIMLSGETAIGRHALLAVQTMDRIAFEVERSSFFSSMTDAKMPPPVDHEETVVRAAGYASHDGARPLIVYTWTGRSALRASKMRIPGTIYALTPFDHVQDRMSLMWGVTPLLVPLCRTTDELLEAGEKMLLKAGLIEVGQEVVVLAGQLPMVGATNIMKISTVDQPLGN